MKSPYYCVQCGRMRWLEYVPTAPFICSDCRNTHMIDNRDPRENRREREYWRAR